MTKEQGEHNLIDLSPSDLEDGATFGGNGFIRPTTLFTIDGMQVNRSLGKLKAPKIEEVLGVVRGLLT